MNARLSDWKKSGKWFLSNGNKIFYKEEGKGEVLLIFHGYPYNSFDFHEVWNGLTQKFRVIIPDMLGMGFSDKPKNYRYTFDDHADMYTSFMQQLKIQDVHFLAHDLGNSVVQELIARDQRQKNPFKIKSIAFLNGGLFIDAYKPRWIQILLSQSPKPIGKMLSNLLSKKNTDRATASVFGPYTKPSGELLQIFWEILNFNGGKSIAYLIGRLVFAKKQYQLRWIKAMQETTIPMCFINGPADPNSGIAMAQRYNELIPGGYVVLLNEHIGHWPQLEAPEAVLEALAEFHKNSATKQSQGEV
jgi:pimeloyl-ACP methyl ester carboxylesterase